MIKAVAGAVGKVFGYASEKEKNVNVKYYQKQIRRNRIAINHAQSYFELQDELLLENNPKKIKKLKKKIRYHKRKFREID